MCPMRLLQCARSHKKSTHTEKNPTHISKNLP